MPPRSSAADTAVSPPEASTRERNSLASRVLPIPASPRMTAAAPVPAETASHVDSSSVSSRSRPIRPSRPGAAGRTPAIGTAGVAARSRSTSSRVCRDGATPSSRRSRSASVR